jgi:hypothetical protein
MIRVWLVLIALAGVARADTASEAKQLTDAALARYAEADSTGSVFGKIWRLIDSSPHDNLVNAKTFMLEAKADVDKEVKADAAVEAEIKLGDLKTAIADLDKECAAYTKEMKSTLWKMYAGIAIFVIGVFGMSIWAFIRRRARR